MIPIYGSDNNTAASRPIDRKSLSMGTWPVSGRSRFDSGREPMQSNGVLRSRGLAVAITPSELERLLWGLVAVSLIGDVLTTFVGLHLGLTESNPVAHSAITGYGVIGMLALKAGALAVGLACRPLLPPTYRAVVPAGLAIPWTLAVGINIYMISTVV